MLALKDFDVVFCHIGGKHGANSSTNFIEEQRVKLDSYARGRSAVKRLAERAEIVRTGQAGYRNRRGTQDQATNGSAMEKAFPATRRRPGGDTPRPGRTPGVDAEDDHSEDDTREAHDAGALKCAKSGSRRRESLGLKPHRVETFKVSRDPQFAEKLHDHALS